MSRNQNVLSALTLNARVNREYALLDSRGKARARAIREQEKRAEALQKEAEEYAKRVEEARRREVLDKASAERRFFSTPSEEGKRQQMLREREDSRTRGDLRVTPFSETLLAMKEAKEMDDFGKEVSRIAEERRAEISREAEVIRLNEEFVLLIQETPAEVLSSALELGDIDLSASLSWEVLESLQEAIEVALEL